MKMKTSLFMLKTAGSNAKKRGGKADHVVASALRALTITKATNSIFDLIFTLIKNPTKDIFLIPLNLIEIPIKVPTFHLFFFPPPLSHRNV